MNVITKVKENVFLGDNRVMKSHEFIKEMEEENPNFQFYISDSYNDWYGLYQRSVTVFGKSANV